MYFDIFQSGYNIGIALLFENFREILTEYIDGFTDSLPHFSGGNIAVYLYGRITVYVGQFAGIHKRIRDHIVDERAYKALAVFILVLV